MPTETTVTVRALLDAAQLTVSSEEFDRFVGLYPALRAQADALYLPDMDSECPALAFDPLG
jgi:transcriptional regulator GlxA family with amidase domain